MNTSPTNRPGNAENDSDANDVGDAAGASTESAAGAGGEFSPAPGPFLRMRDFHKMVADVRAGDGVDPREEKRQRLRTSSRRKPDIASERLSRQIFDALCLSSLLADLGLGDFTVVNVVFAGRAGHYLVDVGPADPDAAYEPREVERILHEKKGQFRAEVAQAVNRRKAPELQFRVLPPGLNP